MVAVESKIDLWLHNTPPLPDRHKTMHPIDWPENEIPKKSDPAGGLAVTEVRTWGSLWLLQT
jgi:hypothetical protein